MKIRLGDLKKVIEETWKPEETGWMVKAGNLLVKNVVEPPSAWRWEFFPEAQVFKREELQRGPSGPGRAQTWVFERNGTQYAIDAMDFYKPPRTDWDHTYPWNAKE